MHEPYTLPSDATIAAIMDSLGASRESWLVKFEDGHMTSSLAPPQLAPDDLSDGRTLHVEVTDDGATIGGIARDGDGFRAFSVPVEHGAADVRLIGYVAVDTAQLVISDPINLPTWEDDDPFSVEPDLNARPPAREGYPFSCGGACAAACNEQSGGQLTRPGLHESIPGIAVAVRTGLGDGLYPVYAVYKDTGPSGRRVARVVIDFMD